MPLPSLILRISNNIYGVPETGNLVYNYSPFKNLQNKDPDTDYPDLTKEPLLDLTLPVENAGLRITEPIDLEVEPSYDNSVNLIVNDKVNTPKIVNSRFYQTSTTKYTIADRKGNLDTNIYTIKDFSTEASLIKFARTVVQVDFVGLKDGGNLKVGNYTIYFKLADSDGNETDFVSETGKIVCHVGSINNPQSIRGGQLNENSYKAINLKLKNLDLAYDFINVYFTRSTGSGDEEFNFTYRVLNKFKITGESVYLTLTGYEELAEISAEEINISYSNFGSVKSLVNCQSMTFSGGVSKNYELFKILEKYSLFIVPGITTSNEGIGNLNQNYKDDYNKYEYYNANNIYYELGYWDQEIYRLGIVYILNDYTLSPEFNLRGVKSLKSDTAFQTFKLSDSIEYNEDFILKKSSDDTNPENSKGVFRIEAGDLSIFDEYNSIRPLGLMINFMNNVVDGDYGLPGLKDLTKGFFIVRQKRIPTILAQGVGIATSEKAKIPLIMAVNGSQGINYNYITEAFLKNRSDDLDPILGSSIIKVEDVLNNALLCPEANLRKATFNSFFNSNQFKLKTFGYSPKIPAFISHGGSKNYVLDKLKWNSNNATIETELTLVEPGIELISNSGGEFSSKAGDALVAHKHLDPINGSFEDFENTEPNEADFNDGISKVRGEFNTYLGTSATDIVHGQYYNIFEANYDFDNNWKDYFKIRFSDGTPFFPITDRLTWNDYTDSADLGVFGKTYYYSPVFRGDCYINTVTQRMNWNFIDPEMPTNRRVINPYTWVTNFKVKTKTNIKVNSDGSTTVTGMEYNKLLPLFTYRQMFIPDFFDQNETLAGEDDVVLQGILEPEDKKFKKYSQLNGTFGYEKIQRPDVNAVPLGYWVTLKICSNVNLAMRDLDFTRPEEEALHKHKRGFYPFLSLDPKNPLPDSDVLNLGISRTTGEKYYYSFPDVPFVQTDFSNRIHFSNPLIVSNFANGNRVFQSKNYVDYGKEYGAIVKLVNWYERILVVLEHGILLLPVNERALIQNESGETIAINSAEVLPKKPVEISNTFGSLWPESVIKTPSYVYGIDTVAKKIWRTNGNSFEIISDFVIQKFLNDNINLLEIEQDKTIGVNFVKSHYNAFKSDVMFTFSYNDHKWNLCWNELTNKWITKYSWIPEFSENINNIFYTFANQDSHALASNYLYKHGFSGTAEESGNIKPTTWYDEKHSFEFEFIVTGIPGIQKIFENLEIISNKTEPDSLFFEVVGEAYDWNSYKQLIFDLNNTSLELVNGVDMSSIPTAQTEENIVLRYKEYLLNTPSISKIPFIIIQSFDINDANYFYRNRAPLSNPFNANDARDFSLRVNTKTGERLFNVLQRNANLKTFGRLRGNSQYLEDLWRIQIQSPVIKFAYISNGEVAYIQKGFDLRDKYLKVRIKYLGDDYAIITAIKTLFNISYA